MIDRKTDWDDENSKFWKWIVILIFIGLGFFFMWGEVTNYKYNKDHRFTIATTTGNSNGGWVDFEFSVNNVVYKRSNRSLSLKSKKCKILCKILYS
jgi:hypothetical protein